MTRSPAAPGGNLVLDSEALAKAVLRGRNITGWLALARADDLRVIASAPTWWTSSTHASAACPGMALLSPPLQTGHLTHRPAGRRPLPEIGLHGHKHAVDAMFSAIALAAPGPVTILTAGLDHCGPDNPCRRTRRRHQGPR